MISKTNAKLLKQVLITERSIMDATAGRVLRARAAYGEKDMDVADYCGHAANRLAEAGNDLDKLIDDLDTFIRS